MCRPPQGDPSSAEAVTLSQLPTALWVGVVAACLASFVLLPALTALVASGLAILLGAIGAIDARHFRIPDRLSLPAIPLGVVAALMQVEVVHWSLVALEHTFAGVLGGGILWLVRYAYSRVRKIEGLGRGDVKLTVAGGTWVGAEALPLAILLACGMGIVLVLALSLRSADARIGARTALPFGALLAPAIWVVWFGTMLVQLP